MRRSRLRSGALLAALSWLVAVVAHADAQSTPERHYLFG
jgi:hypothetical protein